MKLIERFWITVVPVFLTVTSQVTVVPFLVNVIVISNGLATA